MSVSSMAQLIRRISFVGVLFLSLSLSVPALKAKESGPPDEVEVTLPSVNNPSFGTAPSCNTTGWITVGNVTALTEAQAGLSGSDNCVARIYSIGNKSSKFAKLVQTLTVPNDLNRLQFTIWPYTDNPAAPNSSQTISLRDANGNTIYTRSRNISSTTPITFKFDLAHAYPKNRLTLEISTSTGEDFGLPNDSILHIDNVHFTKDNRPDPEGGTGGW